MTFKPVSRLLLFDIKNYFQFLIVGGGVSRIFWKLILHNFFSNKFNFSLSANVTSDTLILLNIIGTRALLKTVECRTKLVYVRENCIIFHSLFLQLLTLLPASLLGDNWYLLNQRTTSGISSKDYVLFGYL